MSNVTLAGRVEAAHTAEWTETPTQSSLCTQKANTFLILIFYPPFFTQKAHLCIFHPHLSGKRWEIEKNEKCVWNIMKRGKGGKYVKMKNAFETQGKGDKDAISESKW